MAGPKPPGFATAAFWSQPGDDTHTVVYALLRPGTNDVRYVGFATNPLRRLEEHIAESPGNPRLREWIDGLLAEGLVPEMRILEECSLKSWAYREPIWIAYYRLTGQIFNIEAGGPPVKDPGKHLLIMKRRAERAILFVRSFGKRNEYDRFGYKGRMPTKRERDLARQECERMAARWGHHT